MAEKTPKLVVDSGPVMARYRELKAGGMAGLEASRVVLKEATGGGLQTPANTDLQTCACGKKARPRGTDCWACYRKRGQDA